MGSNKVTKRIRKDLEDNPLKVYNEPMKQVTQLKYLGETICSTPEESIHQTLLKRIALAKKSIFEIRAVIEDRRAYHIGGFNLALEIWDGAISSMLYTNGETWGNLPKKSMKLLEDLYILVYRSLLQSQSGSPKVNYF